MTTQRRDLGPGDVLVEIRSAVSATATSATHAANGAPSPTPTFPVTRSPAWSPRSALKSPAMPRATASGVGCMVGSCGACASCRKGQEQYCLKGTTLTYGSVDRDGTLTQGGYSTHVVVDQAFVLPVPDGIGLAEAAPLLCGRHGLLPAAPLGRRPRHHGGGQRPRRARPPRRQARPRDGRRRHRALAVTQKARRRPAPGRQPLLRQEINRAYQRVLASDVRYRFVIDNSTLT
jgi:hypothetical protein